MIKEGAQKIWLHILERVFPEACLGCGQSDQFLCARCVAYCADFQSPGVWNCLVCKELTQNGEVCSGCVPKTSVHQLVSLAQYKPHSVSGKLIEALKYGYSSQAEHHLRDWILRADQIISQIAHTDLIIPIPLHPRRQAERGFNQSEGIAKAVATLVNIPINITVLKRSRFTKQQAKLSKTERQKNLAGAFVVVKPALIKNKDCLLIDDVYTTGSTMAAAAEALRAAGAKKVRGFTIARGL